MVLKSLGETFKFPASVGNTTTLVCIFPGDPIELWMEAGHNPTISLEARIMVLGIRWVLRTGLEVLGKGLTTHLYYLETYLHSM